MSEKVLTYWEKLRYETRPIVLYGTGNGADKIIDACESYGIKIDGVFASSGFVRDRVFRDMHVLSYESVIEQFGEDIVILPAFGTTLPEVMDFFAYLDSKHDVIIPEVPLYGSGIFDAEYLSAHYDDLKRIYGMLSDDTSREVFRNAVLFRITGKLRYLSPCESMRDTMTLIGTMRDVKIALDGGAFKGDSTADMIAAFPNLQKVFACEPDPSTFKKLCAFAESDEACGKVVPVEFALSDKVGVSESITSGSRGSGMSGKNRRAKIRNIMLSTIDNIVSDGRIDYIKLDVEGYEREALVGAEKTIRSSRPIVSLSLYHRTADIIDLTDMISDLLGECKMYLRRPECIPMWDLNLYVVPTQN